MHDYARCANGQPGEGRHPAAVRSPRASQGPGVAIRRPSRSGIAVLAPAAPLHSPGTGPASARHGPGTRSALAPRGVARSGRPPRWSTIAADRGAGLSAAGRHPAELDSASLQGPALHPRGGSSLGAETSPSRRLRAGVSGKDDRAPGLWAATASGTCAISLFVLCSKWLFLIVE